MTRTPSDAFLKKILGETKTIACVGVSLNPVRPSYFVARYLHLRGYRIIPVNPSYAGNDFYGESVRDSLQSIPEPDRVDMVDIFRRPEHVPELVSEAISVLRPGLSTIWMQIGVVHERAASEAAAHGIQVVQDRCPKIEHQRLFGELRKFGFNTGIISSKLGDD